MLQGFFVTCEVLRKAILLGEIEPLWVPPSYWFWVDAGPSWTNPNGRLPATTSLVCRIGSLRWLTGASGIQTPVGAGIYLLCALPATNHVPSFANANASLSLQSI